MRTPPLEVIASWPKPNYTNPTYQGPQLLIIGVILLIISSAIMGLRLWVRIRMKKYAGWDDWIMVAVMPFIMCSTVIANLGTKYGWGYHIWDNKQEWEKPSLMANYFNQVILVIVVTLVKVSILTSYLRFLTVSASRYLSWAIIVLVLGWGLSFLITMLLVCRPLSAYWDTTLDPSAVCANDEARTLAFTITNLIFDVTVLIFPIPILWKLRLPIRERLVLIGLMSLGVVACAASAVRIYYGYRIYNISYDESWDGYLVWLWVLVEVNLAVICASIPFLRPLVRRYLPQLGFKESSYTQQFNMNDANNIHGGAPILTREPIFQNKSSMVSTEPLWR